MTMHAMMDAKLSLKLIFSSGRKKLTKLVSLIQMALIVEKQMRSEKMLRKLVDKLTTPVLLMIEPQLMKLKNHNSLQLGEKRTSLPMVLTEVCAAKPFCVALHSAVVTVLQMLTKNSPLNHST